MEYSIRVMSYETYKGFVEFNVRVKAGEEGMWHFRRRFSVLREWNEALRSRYGEILPIFPAKTWCRSFNPVFLRERMQNLEIYLQQIAEIREIANNQLFQGFIQPKDSVYLVNPKYKFSRTSEILEKAFKSTEAECKRVMQMTIRQFMGIDELPTPIDESELTRRHTDMEHLLEHISPPAWSHPIPCSAVLTPLSLHSTAVTWTHNKATELQTVLNTINIPCPSLLLPV